MTEPSNDKPKVQGDKGGQGRDPSDPGHEGQSELDIEPDALLDSLLADDHDAEEHLAGEVPELDADEEDEVTGVVQPAKSITDEASAAKVPDEFSDVDDLLENSKPPPPPIPVTKSTKATLQGIKPVGIPRPLLGAPARPGAPLPPRAAAPQGPPAPKVPPAPKIPAPKSPPAQKSPRAPKSVAPTQKPPSVNPAGPTRREPFLPATSPKAPPARVSPLPAAHDDSEEEPTFRAFVTDADLEASRPSRFGLADELEPDEFDSGELDSSELESEGTAFESVPDFEDVDEDILESVPPEPPESLRSEADHGSDPHAPTPSLPSLAPLPEEAELPPSFDSAPPAAFAALDGIGRRPADTLLEDEATELLDSIPPDEALGTYRSERSAQEHLTETGRLEEWRARGEWFEREARAMADPAAKARALLVASEHFVMAGDLKRARSVAAEIHAVQPTMTMGSRQLRWLAAVEQDFKTVLGALELETRAAPTPLARAHAANLAADVHRVWFDDAQNARRKLDLAARVLPQDPRPYVLRLAEQLGQSAHPPRLRWQEQEELAPLLRVGQELDRLRSQTKPSGEPSSTQAINLEEIRRCLANRDIPEAIEALARLGRARGLRRAALWLAASLAAHDAATRPRAVDLLSELVVKERSLLARQALAARALERGDGQAARSALREGDELSPAFDAATRVALGVLTDGILDGGSQDLAELGEGPLRPLAAAAEAAGAKLDQAPEILTGDERQKDEIRTGRALAALLRAGADWFESEGAERKPTAAAARLRRANAAYAAQHGQRPLTQVLELEFALAEGDAPAVASVLSRWPGMETGPAKALAGALALEVAGERDAAQEQYKRALELDPTHEAATRALLSGATPVQSAELLARLADGSDDPTHAGFLLLEAALARSDDPKASEEHLVQAATSAPDLPLVYLLGEQQARQRGDADLLLSWLRQRRESATDSVDRAFDYVREALLVAESDMELAASLLSDAVAARPSDVALHELHERLASQAGVERGKWRESVAEGVSGDGKQRLLLEAALEYERAGDLASAARAAAKAEASGGSEFVKLTAERLGIAQGNTAALSEMLLKQARTAPSEREQRELYERLSELDETKRDHSSSLLWQSAILERTPDYLPALRRLEHEYIGTGRWEELEPIALELSRQLDIGESDARAIWVGEQRILSGQWQAAAEAIEIANKREHPSLWALRARAAQTRGSDNLESALRVELELMDRAKTPLDIATLSLRAAEVATRLGKLDAARALLQRAIQQVPNHLVALTTLADVLEAMGSAHDAAEALEAAASAYQTTKHQVELWHQAAVLWQDSVNNEQRAIHALEAAVERDITHPEAFRRLQAIYVRQRETQKLADLLERRLERTTDRDERIAIEVMRGQALAGVGERKAAREAFAAALDANPEHADALGAFAELCLEDGDWIAAEQAWIRLARHLSDPAQQAAIYTKLGGLYDRELPNPERAKLAYHEVLKRDPENAVALERLVEVHVALRDLGSAVELQQRLLQSATTDDQKRDRTLGLARIHERLSEDPKQAVAILESAKKAFGQDSHVLRAHAELLQRRGEDRTLGMLLDRAANDARRALGTGRFDTTFFEVLSTVSDLRGALDGAAVARATLAALRAEAVDLIGGGPRAADQRLDELLAPPALSTPLRILLQKAGHVLDSAYPVDLKALRAEPLVEENQQLQTHVEQVASGFGISGVEIYVSPALGPICMPVSSSPARLVYGQSLLHSDKAVARYFLLIRALKIIQTGAATLSRTAPIDLWPLMAGFLNIFAANWEPQGADARKTAQATQRIRQVMTGPLDNDVPVLALEVIGSIGNRASQLAIAANQFGNRTGLLAVGDPNAALEGVALAAGQDRGLPTTVSERLKWIVRNSEARDLAIFSVTEHYVQAREALGLSAG